MAKDESNIKKYEAALSLLFYEGQIGWQMNIVFIAINAAIISLIIKKTDQGDLYNAILGLIGLIISIVWWFTFSRNSKYYHFRMAQAREIEPEKWGLLAKRGYDFSKGEEIIIDKGIDINKYPNDVSHQLTFFEKKARNKVAMLCVLWFSILFYFYLLIDSLWRLGIFNKINSNMLDYSTLFSGLIPSVLTCLITSLILLWAYKKQFKIFESQILEQRKQIIEQSRQIDSQLLVAKNQSSMAIMLKLDKEFNGEELKKTRKELGKLISTNPNLLDKNEIKYKSELTIDLEDILDFFDTVSFFVEKKYIYEEDAWHFFDAWFIKYYEFYIRYNIKANSGRENAVWNGLSKLKTIFDEIEQKNDSERKTIELSDLIEFFEEEESL